MYKTHNCGELLLTHAGQTVNRPAGCTSGGITAG